MRFFLLVSVFTGFCFFAFPQSHKIYINEIMASNISTIKNPYSGDYSDWFEIYNADTTDIEIKDFYLTDDPNDSRKWQISFTKVMKPGEYMLFWADDIDEYNHTNFKLGRSGEFLGLYDLAGNVIDSISFGYQEDDLSYGRNPADVQSWVYFEFPTPGEPNSDTFYDGRAENPLFSIPGGYYAGSQTLTLSHPDPLNRFYYTTDGTIPDESAYQYTVPILMNSTTAIRVRSFAAGKLPGEIITQTYLINEDVNLPVISLVTDPANLFDDEKGIYVIGTNGRPGYCTDKPMNVNQDWERPVNIELYDMQGNMELNQQAGVKIFGGCSRTRYPQKSLALFARGIYGKGSFNAQLFKDKPIYEFESFILRNSADDCRYTMFKDAMGQAILEDTHIDRQGYRPTEVFINGQYWGIHNIREKLNEHYVAGNFNIDLQEVNLLTRNPADEWNVLYGSGEHYNTMIRYVERQDMIGEEDFAYIESKMDVDNYIDYQIAQIYLSAGDWPGNNIKFWRAASGPLDRWRWIIYDLDNCFIRTERNTLDLATDPWCDCGWPNPPWSTKLFRRALVNETFRNTFIQRYAWHMNTTFHPERVIHYIDSMRDNIAAAIPRHIERWGGQTVPEPESWIGPTFNSMEEWESHIDRMRRFILERKPHATQHVIDYFSLEGTVLVSIENPFPAQGIIKIADQKMTGTIHTGNYFMNVPLAVKAIPSLGYTFSHWEYTAQGSGTQQLQTPVMDMPVDTDFSLKAHFMPTTEPAQVIVINEINYHSGEKENPGDWIELYNRKNEIIDLSGWIFMDENEDHIFSFPSGTEIEPHGYLVLCEDIASFRLVFPEVGNAIGNLGFGLNNGGESLRLYAPGKIMIDRVTYDDEPPWPPEPDGLGPTLELVDVSLDNEFAENWRPSYGIGTPGKQNFSNSIDVHSISQNYPNPCGGFTNIEVAMETPGLLQIRIHDVFGRYIATIVNEYKEKARYQFILDSNQMPTGLYLYTMVVDNRVVDTKKMVVIH